MSLTLHLLWRTRSSKKQASESPMERPCVECRIRQQRLLRRWQEELLMQTGKQEAEAA